MPRTDSEDLVEKRFPNLAPVKFYSIPAPKTRINILTDSVSPGSLFGGVGTALILGALLAKKNNADLRIITRLHLPESNAFAEILKFNGLEFDQDVSFAHSPPFEARPLDLHEKDVFLTTSWWTTKALLNSLDKDRIFYLLQEDERAFYPHGEDFLRSSRILRDMEIRKIINSKFLFDHLVAEGLAQKNHNAIHFEPAFSRKSYFWDEELRKPKKKKQLLFYARPNHPRNLYHTGLETLELAVRSGVIDCNEWELNFVGVEHNAFYIDGHKVNCHGTVNWETYGKLMRSSDIALCLMCTPHPSYPPYDAAASGNVVVTNKFANKVDMSRFSKNIICCGLEPTELVEGLKQAVDLVSDPKKVKRQYDRQSIGSDWNKALEKQIEWISERMPDSCTR